METWQLWRHHFFEQAQLKLCVTNTINNEILLHPQQTCLHGKSHFFQNSISNVE